MKRPVLQYPLGQCGLFAKDSKQQGQWGGGGGRKGKEDLNNGIGT
jgi:hypothetical protein